MSSEEKPGAREKVTDDRSDSGRVQKVTLKSTVAYGRALFQKQLTSFA